MFFESNVTKQQQRQVVQNSMLYVKISPSLDLNGEQTFCDCNLLGKIRDAILVVLLLTEASKFNLGQTYKTQLRNIVMLEQTMYRLIYVFKEDLC